MRREAVALAERVLHTFKFLALDRDYLPFLHVEGVIYLVIACATVSDEFLDIAMMHGVAPFWMIANVFFLFEFVVHFNLLLFFGGCDRVATLHI